MTGNAEGMLLSLGFTFDFTVSWTRPPTAWFHADTYAEASLKMALVCCHYRFLSPTHSPTAGVHRYEANSWIQRTHTHTCTNLFLSGRDQGGTRSCAAVSARECVCAVVKDKQVRATEIKFRMKPPSQTHACMSFYDGRHALCIIIPCPLTTTIRTKHTTQAQLPHKTVVR